MVNDHSERNEPTSGASASNRNRHAALGKFQLAGRIAKMRASFERRFSRQQSFTGAEPTAITVRRGHTLAGKLVVLVAAVALPLMTLGAGALLLQYRTQRASAEAQSLEQARTIARLVDREIERAEAVAETLAAAVPAVRGDLEALEGELRTAQRLLAANLLPDAPLPTVTLLDARGHLLLHTAWAPAERRQGLPGTQLGLTAITQGRPQLSDLFFEPGSHAAMLALAVPIFAAKAAAPGREIVGAIGITIPRERMIAIVNEVAMPSGAVASIHDRKGVIVARSFRDKETVGKSPVPAALDAILAAPSGYAPRNTTTLENVPSFMAFAHAPNSNYVVAINLPEATVFAPLRESLIRSAAIGTLMLAAGLGLAVFRARDIVRAFRLTLAGAANGLRERPRKSSRLREADELASLLATAFAERERATASARALFENSPIGMVIFDTEGRVHEANDAFLAMVGQTRSELEAGPLNWDDMTPASRLPADEAAFAEALAVGKCTPYEKQCRHSDGHLVPVLMSFGLTDRASGLAAAFIVDLSEQRKSKAAYRETEERLNFSLQAGRLGAWELDLASQRIHCSKLAQALYGRVLDGDVSLTQLVSAVHPDDRDRLLGAIARAGLGHEEFRIEYRVIWPDESIHWIEVRGRVLHEDGKSTRLAGVSADITERKQAEAALRESEMRLRAITDTMP